MEVFGNLDLLEQISRFRTDVDRAMLSLTCRSLNYEFRDVKLKRTHLMAATKFTQSDPPALARWAILSANCPIDGTLANVAAGCGNAAVLEWLELNDCYLGTELWFTAAYNGRLGIVEYLDSVGCPWNE